MYRDAKGKTWFKGNLHMHTTESDGVCTPEEAFREYLEKGYDFVARTDHWKESNGGWFENMLLLRGCEYNVGNTPKEGIFHILGIGMEETPKLERGEKEGQKVIDEIHRAGGLAILAHPAWSLNSDVQIAALKDIDAVEIYNSVSGLPRNARPYSGLLLDILASRGYLYPMVATDDLHFHLKEDTCRSFIMVEALECTKEAIMEAIRDGLYYASQGPVIDVKWEDGKIMVYTSPVEEIVYYTDSVWTKHRADVGHGLTYGEYEPVPNDTYVRVEVRDKEGNYAWGQYIRVIKEDNEI